MKNSRLQEVIQLLAEEKVTEARRIFKDIPTEETAEYYYTKGMLAHKFQNWGDAINAFNKVLEIDPKNSDAKNNLHIIQNILNFWNPEMFNP